MKTFLIISTFLFALIYHCPLVHADEFNEVSILECGKAYDGHPFFKLSYTDYRMAPGYYITYQTTAPGSLITSSVGCRLNLIDNKLTDKRGSLMTLSHQECQAVVKRGWRKKISVRFKDFPPMKNCALLEKTPASFSAPYL